MEEKESGKKIRSWLQTPEAREILKRTAEAIRKEALIRGLSYALFQKDPFGRYSSADLPEEIMAELGLFLVENASRFQHRLILDDRKVHLYLKRSFINHWISISRGGRSDPRRHLRRRVLELLREEGPFHTVPRGRSTCFSMVPGARAVQPLAEEDIAGIPFPWEKTESVTYEKVNRKETLLMLARHFWEEVSLIWERKPVCVDVSDFVTWIGLHVPLRGTSGGERP
jgi:hypothetical protein